MLEFSGTISEDYKLYLLKRTRWLIALSYFITCLILGTIITIMAFLWDKSLLFFLVGCGISFLLFCIPLIAVYIPATMKKLLAGMNSKTPIKVTINDDLIAAEFAGIRDNMYGEKDFIFPLSSITKVIDMGDWFYFVDFKVRNKELYCVCQKNLITKGTIEEFEKLFEGKIVVSKKAKAKENPSK